MWNIGAIASAALFCVGLLLAIAVSWRGIRESEPLDKVFDRAQWYLLAALGCLQSGIPRVRTPVIVGALLLILRASWSFFSHRRSSRG